MVTPSIAASPPSRTVLPFLSSHLIPLIDPRESGETTTASATAISSNTEIRSAGLTDTPRQGGGRQQPGDGEDGAHCERERDAAAGVDHERNSWAASRAERIG